MSKGQSPVIYGDGTQSRDFTYVENVVNANVLAADAKDASGEVFNIAGGKTITLLELVDMLNELLDTNLKPRLTAPRAGDPKKSLASIEKAKRLLGYKEVVSFKEGPARTAKWALS